MSVHLRYQETASLSIAARDFFLKNHNEKKKNDKIPLFSSE
ncbi:hypothetical protein D922_00622 [Enterococcus faecalis 06-MB-DW-09]|nr:hypothetical protein D922_00622 [Enterococcus faecalis 06-MB-DW-09]